MADDLNGRRALVTGASGGIGGALAIRLAEHGADIALSYASHREDAEAVAQRVSELGRNSVVLQADLRDPDTPGAIVRQARQALGGLDALVPNAGTGTQLPWQEVETDTWDATMAVNLRAPWLMCQAALPDMAERGFGRILLVSSIAALNGGVVGPHYAASKAGLHGVMHHLAARMAGSGVTVNTIAPALIAGTRILPTDPDDSSPTPMSVPVGHLGSTTNVADMAIAMVTNPYLTDKVITLDGGLHPG